MTGQAVDCWGEATRDLKRKPPILPARDKSEICPHRCGRQDRTVLCRTYGDCRVRGGKRVENDPNFKRTQHIGSQSDPRQIAGYLAG